jgi:hypothetical protein
MIGMVGQLVLVIAAGAQPHLKEKNLHASYLPLDRSSSASLVDHGALRSQEEQETSGIHT